MEKHIASVHLRVRFLSTNLSDAYDQLWSMAHSDWTTRECLPEEAQWLLIRAEERLSEALDALAEFDNLPVFDNPPVSKET